MKTSIVIAAALLLAAGPALAERNNSAGEGGGDGTHGSGSGHGTVVASNDSSPTFHTYSGSHADPGAAKGGEFGGIGIGGNH